MIVGKEYKDKFLPHWEKWKRVTFRGYNYGGIIANELGNLHHNDFKGSRKNFSSSKSLRIFLLSVIYKHEPLFLRINSKESVTADTIGFLNEEDGRGDYSEQCNFVINQLSNYQLRDFKIHKPLKYRRRFNIKHFFSKLNLSLNILFKVPILGAFRINALAKSLILVSKSLIYYDFIQYLEDSNSLHGLKLLIVFSDMKEYGNLFVQVAGKRNLPTATLQHGIYIQQNDSNFSQSAINYLNSPSNYLLGWGSSVIDMFSNSLKKAILLSGTSVKDYQTKQFFLSPKQVFEKHNKFCVLFSRQTLSKSNLNMLEIAEAVSKNTGLRYDVLMHPSNIAEDYEFEKRIGLNSALKGSSNLISLIDGADFCICHSTTVYFTVLLKRKRCFRLSDNLFIDYGGLDDKITTPKDLLDRLKQDENASTEQKDEKIEQLLIHHFGQPSFSYRESVRRILDGDV